MSDHRSDLNDFLQEATGEVCSLQDHADVFDSLGIEGDDGFEFIESFAARFGVDVSNYRWYFHHGEEGMNLAGFFFAPPDSRVERIPITPVILLEAIESKRWPLQYPLHRLPKVRWDLRLNQLFLVALTVVALTIWAWSRSTS